MPDETDDELWDFGPRSVTTFLLQPHVTKPRIFAVMKDETLVAVATLPDTTTDVARAVTQQMILALNSGETAALDKSLTGLPPAVAAGIRQAIPAIGDEFRPEADLGQHDQPVFELDRWFSTGTESMKEMALGADRLYLGFRASTVAQKDDDRDYGAGWTSNIRTSMGAADPSDDPRGWAWDIDLIGGETFHGAFEEAMEFAEKAADAGKWVRVHNVFVRDWARPNGLHDDEDDGGGNGSAVWVVDVALSNRSPSQWEAEEEAARYLSGVIGTWG